MITLDLIVGRLFPTDSGVRVIAEPGRYFVEGSFLLYARIFSKREIYSRELLDRLLHPKEHTAERALSFDGDELGMFTSSFLQLGVVVIDCG